MDERYKKVKQQFKEEIGAGQVTFHCNFSKVVVKEFKDNYFDWIYVDGNHLCDFV